MPGMIQAVGMLTETNQSQNDLRCAHRRRGMQIRRTAVAALITVLLWPLGAAAQKSGGEPKSSSPPSSGYNSTLQGLGTALTPAHFPHHTPEDVRRMFEEARELGPYGVTMHQWQAPEALDVAAKLSMLASQYGLKMALAVSPTTLSNMRGDLDMPSEVRRAAAHNVSFTNSVVRQAFIKHALDLSKLKPAYLCLATEINLLALKDIKEYIAFAETVKAAYPEIKKISPETKVFVSFQWDVLRMMDIKQPDKISEHTKLIDAFRPALDVVAFTTYPGPQWETAAALPADYYSSASNHVKSKDEVGFMEVGWPAHSADTMAQQAEFVRRLPQLLGPLHPSFVWWSLLHDVATPALNNDLASTGLIQSDDKPKPAYDAFRRLGGKR